VQACTPLAFAWYPWCVGSAQLGSVCPPWNSACPFTCFPPATSIVPSDLTVAGWQTLHVAAVTVPVSGGWPVGGIPWQPVQPSGPGVFHAGVGKTLPVTLPNWKLPWQ
jgi:hypothetical protein